MPKHPVQRPEWIDTAPILVEESIVIAATPGAVWGHIADHESWPEWFEALDTVVPGDEAASVGGTRRVTANRVSIDEEFTAWDPAEHFAFAVVGTPLPILASMAESVRLEPDGDDDTRCRVTYRQGLRARRGFGWLLRRLWAKPAKDLTAALSALKSRVESGG